MHLLSGTTRSCWRAAGKLWVETYLKLKYYKNRGRKPAVTAIFPIREAISRIIFHFRQKILAGYADWTVFAVDCRFLFTCFLLFCLHVVASEHKGCLMTIYWSTPHWIPIFSVFLLTLCSAQRSPLKPGLTSKIANCDPALIHSEHGSIL